LRNTILIAGAGPELDLLDGDAIGNTGGLPRHAVDLQAGLFKGGIGARLDANWQSASFVRGAAGTGDLFFSATPRFDLRLFVNLGEQGRVAAKAPWLRVARLGLSVDNLFDTRPRVRDAAGAVPLAYQPAYLDPLGRVVRVNFRAALP
jgi:outer membrane receptor protein involved in Fe transport